MNATVKVLPPALERAEENFKGTKREGKLDMTRRVERPHPMTPYALLMDIARQMPFVALLGYFLFQVDARNEKNSAARMEEMKDNNRTLLAVVASNTAVMQRVADRLPEIERAISRP